jgi:hypothetical protein
MSRTMWKAILKATLISGTLGIVAVFSSAYIVHNKSPDRVLKYIASGVFGNEAYDGGYSMIAFACVAVFFAVYPRARFLHKSDTVNSLLIGVNAWVVTNLVTLPLSHISLPTFTFINVVRVVLILDFYIGLPIIILARKYYPEGQ